jgi:cytochrome c553
MSSPGNSWRAASIGVTAGIAAVAIIVGFLWLPLASGTGFADVWDAICSAAGLVRNVAGGAPVEQPTYTTSQVEVTPQLLDGAGAESIGRGATLALRCTMCHGARGLSEANTPNLAGQYAVGIYKQLVDFKAGARTSAVMAPLVADLSDADMRDLAAYYAYLPRPPAVPPAGAAPRIVASGAPMRGIAPCGACHGTMDHKAGATWLGGQPALYVHAQLMAFAAGTRRNDIDGVMRNVARALTPDEIRAASDYFAANP